MMICNSGLHCDLCDEGCQSYIEVEPVIYGAWKLDDQTIPAAIDDFDHHLCSICNHMAPYYINYEDDWDENLWGEWTLLGQRETGITEDLTPRCPWCGAHLEIPIEDEDDN